MGCDIHSYVEYGKKDEEGKIRWRNFGGRVNPGRNYFLFGTLCKGVRSEFDFGFEEKGIPEDVGYAALNDSRLYITETGKEDRCATLEQAKRWEKCGCKIFYNDNNEAVFVSHPDWHSHSWLSAEEFEKALALYYEKSDLNFKQPEYEALLASMKKFIELGFECRIVFWFDN